MRDLQALREEIDGIDRELTALFARRMNTAREIARCKQALHLPVLDASREAEVLRRRRALLADPALGDKCERLFRLLMTLSREVQEEADEHA